LASIKYYDELPTTGDETGRPTKKERRALDAFVDPAMFGFDEDDWDEDEE
jgi:hypothetical protein